MALEKNIARDEVNCNIPFLCFSKPDICIMIPCAFNVQNNNDTLGTSYKAFSVYLKSQFVNFYRVACNLANSFVCPKTLTNVAF